MTTKLRECLASTFVKFLGQSAKHYFLKHLRRLQPLPLARFVVVFGALDRIGEDDQLAFFAFANVAV